MRKYWYVFKMALQSALEYRVNFFLSLISDGFLVIVQCCLWTAVFASSGRAVINGYTYHQMILYSVAAGVVTKVNSAGGFQNEIAADIKNGAFSKFLTLPTRYSLFRFSRFFGDKVMQLVIAAGILAVFFGVYRQYGTVELPVWRCTAFLFACLGAMVINFILFYAVSALAFTLTEVWGIFTAVNQGVILLGGGIFPLDFFGEKIGGALQLLPFSYTLFFPVNIINGHLGAAEAAEGILIQLFWIGVLAAAAGAAWKGGLKRYVAAGG